MLTYDLKKQKRLSSRRVVSAASVEAKDDGLAVLYQQMDTLTRKHNTEDIESYPCKACPDILEYSSDVHSQPEGVTIGTLVVQWFEVTASSKTQIPLLRSKDEFLDVVIFDSQSLTESAKSGEYPSETHRVRLGAIPGILPASEYRLKKPESLRYDYTLSSFTMSEDGKRVVVVLSVPEAQRRWPRYTVHVWTADVETAQVDRFVVPGVLMKPKTYISPDCRYIAFEEVRDPVVGNDTGNEKKLHIMELETRQWAAIIGDKKTRVGSAAFGSGLKDDTYVLAIAREDWADVYELW